VVEQVPQADGQEAGAGQDVADAVARRAAHGSRSRGRRAPRRWLLQLRATVLGSTACLMFSWGARLAIDR
jgi:hypothetical protein